MYEVIKKTEIGYSELDCAGYKNLTYRCTIYDMQSSDGKTRKVVRVHINNMVYHQDQFYMVKNDLTWNAPAHNKLYYCELLRPFNPDIMTDEMNIESLLTADNLDIATCKFNDSYSTLIHARGAFFLFDTQMNTFARAGTIYPVTQTFEMQNRSTMAELDNALDEMIVTISSLNNKINIKTCRSYCRDIPVNAYDKDYNPSFTNNDDVTMSKIHRFADSSDNVRAHAQNKNHAPINPGKPLSQIFEKAVKDQIADEFLNRLNAQAAVTVEPGVTDKIHTRHLKRLEASDTSGLAQANSQSISNQLIDDTPDYPIEWDLKSGIYDNEMDNVSIESNNNDDCGMVLVSNNTHYNQLKKAIFENTYTNCY